MPFNGSGSFSLIFNWQQDALNNINISSSRMMGQENDIAAGLSLCLTKDGQQVPTANLPMGGFRFTNMGNATAQGNAVSVQDVQNGSVVTLTSVSGTDTITANTAPSIGSYASGQRFQFIAAGANATTNPTLNINGLGAKNITKNGAAALALGDIPSGALVSVAYDGTQFQIQNSTGIGRLINIQIFTASGTYTPTPGTNSIVVEGVGGGGGGGGAANPGAGAIVVAGGGSNGAWGRKRIASVSSQTVTIGGAGAGNVGLAGGNGGTTSFGALLTLPGGGGAPAGPGNTGTGIGGAAGSVSGSPTGADIGSPGAIGSIGIALSASTGLSGGAQGGQYGAGGAQSALSGTGTTTGISATGRGTGGGGAVAVGATTSSAGGSATAGLIAVWEYA